LFIFLLVRIFGYSPFLNGFWTPLYIVYFTCSIPNRLHSAIPYPVGGAKGILRQTMNIGNNNSNQVEWITRYKLLFS
jgi:hypothetical protein